MSETVLVGDVGGTNVRFAVAHRVDGRIVLDHFRILKGDDYDSFREAIADYVCQENVRPSEALFALAGPVDPNGCLTLTNREEWPVIDPRELHAAFHFDGIRLVNDFAAMARAVPEVQADAFETVLSGEAVPDAPVLVTGPGTGFGISTLIKVESRWHVITGQGGHVAFPARTAREFEILSVLQRQEGYVSNEIVVSGKWFDTVYTAVAELHGQKVTLPISPKDVLSAAKTGDPIAREVCQLRANGVLGAAGDVALIVGAHGGVVLTGGVAERILPWLRSDQATARFRDRGSQTGYLASIPVNVMTSAEAPLVGAAALYFDRKDPA